MLTINQSINQSIIFSSLLCCLVSKSPFFSSLKIPSVFYSSKLEHFSKKLKCCQSIIQSINQKTFFLLTLSLFVFTIFLFSPKLISFESSSFSCNKKKQNYFFAKKKLMVHQKGEITTNYYVIYYFVIV